MSAGPREITESASDLIEEEGGLGAFIRNVGVGGIAYAFILQIIEGINSAGELLLGPPRALGRGLISLVDLTIGGLGDVFGAGTATTVRSFTEGTAAILGPLAQPASIGVVMLTLAIFLYGINNLRISPLSFLQNLRT